MPKPRFKRSSRRELQRARRARGDRRRNVGIDPGACDVIATWTERRARLGFGDRHHLFCTTTGRKLSQSHLRTVLHRHANQAGITKRVHPHGLRHTHAYELMMEGLRGTSSRRELERARRARHRRPLPLPHRAQAGHREDAGKNLGALTA